MSQAVPNKDGAHTLAVCMSYDGLVTDILFRECRAFWSG